VRWLLAGASFAVLVGLCVATVALQCVNVRARARLRELERALLAREIELFRQHHLRVAGCTREELARRWRELCELDEARLQ
jgi:hypothetical protein